MTLSAGTRLGPYEILAPLGAGGMGEVYRARDTRLQRSVAIKVLPAGFAEDPERLKRFEREAKATAALSNPNILDVHDVGTFEGVPYLVEELLEGESLRERIGRGALPIHEAVGIAAQIAHGLAAAHGKGIVHRDLKPENVFLTKEGIAKVLDFGLAKFAESVPANDAEAETLTRAPTGTTGPGQVLGTAPYMSPEQVEGKSLDARSDIFSFGAVFYELLTSRQPFHRDSQASTMSAILRDPPPPIRAVRAKVPPGVGRILHRCLEKDRELRYQSAAELHRELAACEAQLTASEMGMRAIVRQPRFVIPAAALLVVLVGAGAWFRVRSSRLAWALNEALPEIERLADQRDFAAAYDLAEQAARHIPGNAKLAQLSRSVTTAVTVETNVPGADIHSREYAVVDGEWQWLGRAPLRDVAIPRGLKRWRISKPGFRTVEAARSPEADGPNLTFALDAEASIPGDMVRVPAAGGSAYLFLTGLDHLPAPALADFLIDTYEVTNRQYAVFVAAGGYREPKYWKEPFVKNGSALSWPEAMAEFRDSTGQPGPANWEFGSYLKGQDDIPVGGVSWYEAAAYADFSGKSLPSIFHWNRAAWTNAGFRDISPVVRLSNFAGQAPARGGRYPGLNPYGTYDLAGNLKEWCWNAAEKGGGRRYVLGGAWNEPVYMFNDPDAQPPMSRLSTYGFRCVKYLSPAPAPLLDAMECARRDFAREKPVADDVFRIYRSLYSIDKTSLEPVVELVDDGSEYWKIEKVSLNAAYGGERLIVYVYLPRDAEPPVSGRRLLPGFFGATQSLVSEVRPNCNVRLHRAEWTGRRLSGLQVDVRTGRRVAHRPAQRVEQLQGPCDSVAQGLCPQRGLSGDAEGSRCPKAGLLRIQLGSCDGPDPPGTGRARNSRGAGVRGVLATKRTAGSGADQLRAAREGPCPDAEREVRLRLSRRDFAGANVPLHADPGEGQTPSALRVGPFDAEKGAGHRDAALVRPLSRSGKIGIALGAQLPGSTPIPTADSSSPGRTKLLGMTGALSPGRGRCGSS